MTARTRILIDGPIAGSYSLAVVNRQIAKELILLGLDVYMTQREGPDVRTDPFFMEEASFQGRYLDYCDIESHSFDVHSKNDWPVFDKPKRAPLLVCHCYAWEETTFPTDVIAKLENFDGIFTTSEFTNDALRSSGYTGFVDCIHNGIDHIPAPAAEDDRTRDRDDEQTDFKFLHISSGLPRKGMDQGIQAFVEEFSHQTNVKLLIKTHHNPDNNIYDALKALSESDREKIELLEQHLTSEGVSGLVSAADFCFFPSHGEGFLLPAAEAMHLGVPVCVTACGGNAAFCTDATAILIPTRLAQSKSRISSGQSAWFEAETSDIRAALRTAYEMGPRARQAMVEAARANIARFKWSRTARLFADGIESLLARGTAKSSPIAPRPAGSSVTIVSTYNQKCGIATFTKSLCDALNGMGVAHTIVSERIDPAEIGPIDEGNVARVWKRDRYFASDIITYLKGQPKQDIIIQHHPGIFSWEALRDLVTALSPYGRSTIVELHSTEGLTGIYRSVVPAISASAKIIVHNSIDYLKVIPGAMEGRNVFAIPHAVPSRSVAVSDASPDPRSEIRIFSFGLCGRHKQFEAVLRIVYYLKLHNYKAKATIITSIDPRNVDGIKYGHDLWVYRQILGLEEDVELIFDFLPLDRIVDIASRCSIAVFPYADVKEGASGAARVAMSAGIPVLVSRSSIFNDLKGVCRSFEADDVSDLMDLVLDVIDDRSKYMDLQKNYMHFATWEKHVTRVLQIAN